MAVCAFQLKQLGMHLMLYFCDIRMQCVLHQRQVVHANYTVSNKTLYCSSYTATACFYLGDDQLLAIQNIMSYYLYGSISIASGF